MKNLYFLIFIIFLTNVYSLFSQDETWFRDITIEAGLEGQRSTYVQASDVNGDNYPDILIGTSGLITGHSQTFSLYLNVPDPANPGGRKFVDFTQESGINVSRITGKPMREYDIAILADIDNDGDVDCVSSLYYHRPAYFIPEIQDRPEVFLNDGTGHFAIKLDAGLAEHQYFPGLAPGQIDGVGLSFLDYDYDGILDLYMATKFVAYYNDGVNPDIAFPDKLFKGIGDGSFVEIDNAGVQDIVEPLYGVNVTDYDNDGWQDVITSPYCRTGGRILRNMQDGSFLDVAPIVGYSAKNYAGFRIFVNEQWIFRDLCQWEAPAADFDNDGDMDILQCLIHGGYETIEGVIVGRTHIAVNQGPPDYNFYDDLSLIHRNANIKTEMGDYGGLWVDFDNNGWQDMVICQGTYYPPSDRVYMCIQRDDHQFYDVTKELGFLYMKDASDAMLCDYDLDGDNDIFIFHSKDTPQLRFLRNDISNKSNWISTKLVAPQGCNKSAVGARITVYSDTLHQIRELQTGMGHFGSQGPFIANFGLGDRNRVDSVIVRWPMKNSPTTKIYNPATNINVIINPDASVNYITDLAGYNPIIKFVQNETYFDTVNVGESLNMSFDVINVGDAQLDVSGFSLEKDDSLNFELLEVNEAFSLLPNETKKINVKFSPKYRALIHSLVTFNSNAINDSTKSHDIIGYGYEDKPMIAASAKDIHFDSTKTPVTKEFKIINPGELDLSVDNILPQSNDNVFDVKAGDNSTITFPLILKPKQEFKINVIFNPKVRKSYTGEVIINSNAYENEIVKVNLTGLGNVPTPLADIDEVFINFKKVPINFYGENNFEIKNIGDGDLHVSKIEIDSNADNAYTLPGLELPLTVLPGNSKVVTLRLEPKELKSYNRQVHVISDAFNSPEIKLNARGTGGDPVFVEEQKFENEYISVKVSPNPFDEYIKINFENIYKQSGNIEISLHNVNGQKIKDIYFGNDINQGRVLQLSTEEIISGFYILRINCNNEILSVPVVKY